MPVQLTDHAAHLKPIILRYED